MLLPKPRLLSSRILLRLITITLALCPCSLKAQEQNDDVIKVSTDLLLFPIRVRDKRGQTVPGLTERDLSVKDDDRIISGLYLSPGADRVALMFALDQSGSLRDLISQQRNAALALFDRFGARSSVAVLRFGESANLTTSFGRDNAGARAAFIFSESRNERTAIFDAANAAITVYRNLPRLRTERRIVILISDGLDNFSETKPGAVIKAARDAQVSFYVIHLPLFTPVEGRLVVRPASKGFRELAEKTGGKYFLAGDSHSALNASAAANLDQIFQAIEQDLKSQYLLGFYLKAAANDGRRHRFSLHLPGNVEYQVSGTAYSNNHQFVVNRPRETVPTPR